VSESPFRRLCRRFGADVVVTEFLSAEGIRRENGHVRIGARTRHRDVESATDLRGTLDVLLDAAPLISDPLIRNMGTVGGSICHADPAGDWGAVMLAVGAEFVVRSSAGERVLPATGFFQGPFTTGLRADEVMTEIRVPVTRGRSGGTYLKLERKIGDFASVAAAVHLVLGDDGRVAAAGIGLCAVAAQSTKATAAEAALVGQTPSDDVIAEAARLAAGAASHGCAAAVAPYPITPGQRWVDAVPDGALRGGGPRLYREDWRAPRRARRARTNTPLIVLRCPSCEAWRPRGAGRARP